MRLLSFHRWFALALLFLMGVLGTLPWTTSLRVSQSVDQEPTLVAWSETKESVGFWSPVDPPQMPSETHMELPSLDDMFGHFPGPDALFSRDWAERFPLPKFAGPVHHPNDLHRPPIA